MKGTFLSLVLFLCVGSLYAQIYVNGGAGGVTAGSAVAGKVGIGPGSSSPGTMLQVGGGTESLVNLGGYSHMGSLRSSGDAFIGANVYAKYLDTLDNSKIRVFLTNSNGHSAIHMSQRGAISFYSLRGSTTADNRINVTGASAMRIVNYNVGIGTEAPGAQLAVVARGGYTGTPSNTALAFINQSTNPIPGGDLKPALELNNGGSGGYGLVSIAAANYISGNVGIGTKTTGSFKVAVEGKIGAREINVTTTSPFPDYVFSKDYALPSLDELKNYIQQNHRLPEMPTAEEVSKDGIDLGEMNVLLVKKIEEMTLYMLQMQKENQQMNERLKKLEEKVR